MEENVILKRRIDLEYLSSKKKSIKNEQRIKVIDEKP